MFRPFLIFAVSLFCAAPAFARDNIRDFLTTSELTFSGEARAFADGSVRLTPPKGGVRGSVFSSQKLPTNTFSTFFAFDITRPGNGGADGIVFILQNRSASLGGNGQGMGYLGVTESVAIEFDTWKNDRHDPDGRHMALLVDGKITHDRYRPASLRGNFENNGPWYVWIDYDGTTLEARLSNKRQRPLRPSISQVIDIPRLLDAEEAWIGFSAACGWAYAAHDILEWTYVDRYAPEEVAESTETAPGGTGQ
ncbi:L-type lectin-domain containing protein [Antarctobacter jejuensis]|uniref:L-type lectin-domain containing protein n=1 Tax=Antarctobacter jejuensis TaxID=1439938 RepID=UPI003FD14FFD